MSKNKVGENLETFENTKINETYKQSEIKSENLYRVIFKQNRQFELFINNEKIIWTSNGINPAFPDKYKNGLPESIINNPDFKTNQKYFTVVKI